MPTYTGTSGSDTITGSAGDDIIDGLGGADTMTGGAGSDTYYVDNVFDSVVENASEGTDTVYASVNYQLSANVEYLYLTAFAVSGSGNSGANRIYGTSADNYLFGGDGADRLYGNDGNDTLYGGTDSSNDLLDGGAGDDVMYGGLGNDVYYVDSLSDAAVEYTGEGYDIIRPTISWTLGSNIEGIQLQGSGNIDATGTSAANDLIGNSGNNTIYGLGGIDELRGGAGNDVLYGNTGNDILYGDAAGDQFVILQESVGVGETDQIYDLSFSDGDIVDLSAIDANSGVVGDQAFTFVSTFTYTAGEIQVFYDSVTNRTEFKMDVDGDAIWDYQLRVSGNFTDQHQSTGPTDGGWIL